MRYQSRYGAITMASPRQIPFAVSWQIFEGASTAPVSFTTSGDTAEIAAAVQVKHELLRFRLSEGLQRARQAAASQPFNRRR